MKKVLFAIFCLLSLQTGLAQERNVMLMEIKGDIDPPMKRYVDLALSHATSIKADLVVIEIDTYGGLLTDAKEIAELILDYEKPVWIFVNAKAISAGALISIACDSIYMTDGASMGGASVVNGEGELAPEKHQSVMRSFMRSIAEQNKRNPKIAEAMVDGDVDVPEVKEKGKVVTLTTSEALQHGYCDAKVSSIQEILDRNGVKEYKLNKFELSRSEKVIAFFLNPFISGILILVIIAGIYFEMQAPGLGFAGLAALVALILYLVPYYLNGLAENWEIIAFFIGLLLIAVEIFVLPGFGVAGISGIILTVGSLILVMVDNDVFDFEFVPMSNLLFAASAAIGGLIGGIILLFVLGSRLQGSRVLSGMALTDTQDRKMGYTSTFIKEPLIGRTGLAYTVLRPSGKVKIDETIYDAYTRGEFIEQGQAIEVISDEGTSLKVKSIAS